MSSRRGWRWIAGAAVPLLLVLVAWWWFATRTDRLAQRARDAERSQDWPTAARLWHEYNAGPQARPASLRAEANAALAAGRAAQAETALRRACHQDPGDPDSWRFRLQILRLEDRSLEATQVGWQAYEAVSPQARPDVLRDLTLALLAEAPDDLARTTLTSWITADPEDVNARVALFRRMATAPHDGDLSRAERVTSLSNLLESHPDHAGLREALVLDLADAGEPDRGRIVLDNWPINQRDARYDRLRGRWDLDYDHRPDHAVVAFQRVLRVLPHDWASRYRLARALRAIGRLDEAKAEAEHVGRLRELLDPSRLGPRLDADLERLDTPQARKDLADLCARVGLTRLAEAWSRLVALPRP